MKIFEILTNATGILEKSGIPEPRREANSLLGFALGKDRTFLITHADDDLSDAEIVRFESFLSRRARREPLQYITGRQEFYGLDFLVTPDVLIPRPETELIVENAVEILKNCENPKFCEIGVGSGCLSTAILHEVQTASAIGLDISEKALSVARINAARHRVEEKLTLMISDVFSALTDEQFDLIVSNPPYIPPTDLAGLQAEVRDFEPSIALTDGRDGLSIIEKIIRAAPHFLKPNGFLLMEIGIHQSSKVRAMLSPEFWTSPEFVPDLQGIPRMLKTCKVEK